MNTTLIKSLATAVLCTQGAIAGVITQMDGRNNIRIENDWDITDDGRRFDIDRVANARGKKPILQNKNGRRNVVFYDHFPSSGNTRDRVEHYFIPRSQGRNARRFMKYSFRIPGAFGNVDKWMGFCQLKQNRSRFAFQFMSMKQNTSNRLRFTLLHYRNSFFNESTRKLSHDGRFFDQSAERTISKNVWYDVLMKYDRTSEKDAIIWLKPSSERFWKSSHMVIRRRGGVGYDFNLIGTPGNWRDQKNAYNVNGRLGLYQASSTNRHSFNLDNVRVGDLWSSTADWRPADN